MSVLKNSLSAAAALAFVCAPIAASAAPAAKPTGKVTRVAAPVKGKKSNAMMGGPGAIVVVLGLGALAVGIGAASSGGSSPNSP